MAEYRKRHRDANHDDDHQGWVTTVAEDHIRYSVQRHALGEEGLAMR